MFSALSIILLLQQPLAISSASECQSRITSINLCSAAKNAERDFAQNLPIKLGRNMTIVGVAAIGPNVSVSTKWLFYHAEIQTVFSQQQGKKDDIARVLQRKAELSACANAELSAFVRLGGTVRYQYTSAEGIVIYEPVVTACGDES